MTSKNTLYSYKIDSHDRLYFVNAAWDKFAIENDSPSAQKMFIIGHTIWDFMEGEKLILAYKKILSKIRLTQQSVKLPFRCDSPGLRRHMEMTIKPIEKRQGHIQFETNVVKGVPRNRIPLLTPDAPRSDNIIKMCGWCNRVSFSDDIWLELDEASAFMDFSEGSLMPHVSHGICVNCYDKILTEV